MELASRQVERGNRVLAVSLTEDVPATLEEAFARGGVRTLHVPKRGLAVDITLPLRLATAFRRDSVDVVHLHNKLPLIYGALAGKLAGCGVVSTRHGLVEGSGRQLWVRRQAARLVDGYVAVSAEVAQNTRANGLAIEPKLMVIENGIDLGFYQPRPEVRAAVRAELGLSDSALAIGSVCRLIHYKNVGLLLRTALPHLSQTTQLMIIGDGPERSALESVAAQHPHGKYARFLGQRADVARLLNGLDLFALSSSTEGHPLAVIEAMATGLPVLATNVGGIPEMLEDGMTGFLAPVDEQAFAARLTAALDQSRNWAAMGSAARLTARERFSSETMAERYLALYNRIRPSGQAQSCQSTLAS